MKRWAERYDHPKRRNPADACEQTASRAPGGLRPPPPLQDAAGSDARPKRETRRAAPETVRRPEISGDDPRAQAVYDERYPRPQVTAPGYAVQPVPCAPSPAWQAEPSPYAAPPAWQPVYPGRPMPGQSIVFQVAPAPAAPPMPAPYPSWQWPAMPYAPQPPATNVILQCECPYCPKPAPGYPPPEQPPAAPDPQPERAYEPVCPQAEQPPEAPRHRPHPPKHRPHSHRRSARSLHRDEPALQKPPLNPPEAEPAVFAPPMPVQSTVQPEHWSPPEPVAPLKPLQPPAQPFPKDARPTEQEPLRHQPVQGSAGLFPAPRVLPARPARPTPLMMAPLPDMPDMAAFFPSEEPDNAHAAYYDGIAAPIQAEERPPYDMRQEPAPAETEAWTSQAAESAEEEASAPMPAEERPPYDLRQEPAETEVAEPAQPEPPEEEASLQTAYPEPAETAFTEPVEPARPEPPEAEAAHDEPAGGTPEEPETWIPQAAESAEEPYQPEPETSLETAYPEPEEPDNAEEASTEAAYTEPAEPTVFESTVSAEPEMSEPSEPVESGPAEEESPAEPAYTDPFPAYDEPAAFVQPQPVPTEPVELYEPPVSPPAEEPPMPPRTEEAYSAYRRPPQPAAPAVTAWDGTATVTGETAPEAEPVEQTPEADEEDEAGEDEPPFIRGDARPVPPPPAGRYAAEGPDEGRFEPPPGGPAELPEPMPVSTAEIPGRPHGGPKHTYLRWIVAIAVVAALAVALYQSGLWTRITTQPATSDAGLTAVVAVTATPNAEPTATQTATAAKTAAVASTVPQLTSVSVEPVEGTAPVTLVFTLETNAAVSAVRIMTESGKLFPITARSTPKDGGLNWTVAAQAEEAYSGEARIFLCDQDGEWSEADLTCMVNVQ